MDVQQVQKLELWSLINGVAFLVHEQFPHLNWLSRALQVALAPQKSTRYWESNSPGNRKEAGCALGDVLVATGTACI